MKAVLFLCASFLALVCVSECKDLIVGSSFNYRLVSQETADYRAIPLIKREKQYFYSDPLNRIIKGIIARDLKQKDATAAITAGGVGFSYVNIRLNSGRGSGLKYLIEIYV